MLITKEYGAIDIIGKLVEMGKISADEADGILIWERLQKLIMQHRFECQYNNDTHNEHCEVNNGF